MLFHLENFEEREVSESRMPRYLVSLLDILKYPRLYDEVCFLVFAVYVLI